MTQAAPAMPPALVADPSGYEHVAFDFARLSRRFTTGLAEALVAVAGLPAGERVLDVGTGSGVVARAAAARVGPAGRVVGVDVSEALLSQARAEAGAAGLLQVDYRRLDAQRLELDDGSFDAVCSLFALTHVADPAAAVREMYRVLRPGGRLALGVGAAPPFYHPAVWRRLAVRLEAWRGGALLSPGLLAGTLGRAGARLDHPPGLSAERLGALLREAGFRELRASWIGGELAVESPTELWELETTFSTPLRHWRATAPPDEVERQRRFMLEAAAAVLARGGRLLYLQGATAVLARRPRA